MSREYQYHHNEEEQQIYRLCKQYLKQTKLHNRILPARGSSVCLKLGCFKDLADVFYQLKVRKLIIRGREKAKPGAQKYSPYTLTLNSIRKYGSIINKALLINIYIYIYIYYIYIYIYMYIISFHTIFVHHSFKESRKPSQLVQE